MRVTFDYDLLNEDDKIDHFYAKNGDKYARFIIAIEDDLRSAWKRQNLEAIGIDITGINEHDLSVMHGFVKKYREYFYKRYNEYEIDVEGP
jgi:hypothetical protein